MKNSFRAALSAFCAVLFVLGCQGEAPIKRLEKPEIITPVVKDSEGVLYSIDCLKNNVQEIEKYGLSAMTDCQVSLAEESGDSRGTYNRCLHYDCGSTTTTTTTTAYIYYPPYYYSPTYYTYYPSNYSSNYTNNYPSYPSSYNPYSNYYNNSSSANFCRYIFGGSYGWNCYYIFGYQNYNYTQSYRPSCGSCLYGYTGYWNSGCNQQQNSCYTQQSIF